MSGACPVPLPALVDAVRSGRPHVVALCERLLRDEGPLPATIALDDAPATEGVAELGGAIIRHGSTRFGRLLAPALPPDRLQLWAETIGAALHLADALADLERLASTDPLTGAGNRRSFEAYLGRSMELASARGLPLRLMVFDIDDFKRYNDRFGHAAGDEVLRETVALLRSVIRRGDAVFRIGGDEFVVVFGDPDSPRTSGSAPLASVEQLVVRFAEGIRTLRLPALGESGLAAIGVSAGMASFPEDGRDAATLVAAADQRALESKRRGKSTVTFGPSR